MVDWSLSEELARDLSIFNNVAHVYLGLYVWEVLITFDFEWDLIRRKTRFTWPFCFYFASRYGVLLNLIFTATMLDMRDRNPGCRAMFTVVNASAAVAISTASSSLAFRTMAIWSHNKFVVCLLAIMSILHMGLTLRLSLTFKAAWVQGIGCVLEITNNALVAAIYGYTMAFDLIVLLLNLWKLSRKRLPGVQRGAVTTALFRDGLAYFIVAFTTNLIATIFMLLRLKSVMTAMFDVPATTISTIVACRVVRRLHETLLKGTPWTSSGRSTRPNRRSTSHATLEPNLGSAIQIRMDVLSSAHATPSKPEELEDRTAEHSEC